MLQCAITLWCYHCVLNNCVISFTLLTVSNISAVARRARRWGSIYRILIKSLGDDRKIMCVSPKHQSVSHYHGLLVPRWRVTTAPDAPRRRTTRPGTCRDLVPLAYSTRRGGHRTRTATPTAPAPSSIPPSALSCVAQCSVV